MIALDSELKPGPDLEREAKALLNLESRMQKSAEEFMEILKHEAVSYKGDTIKIEQ